MNTGRLHHSRKILIGAALTTTLGLGASGVEVSQEDAVVPASVVGRARQNIAQAANPAALIRSTNALVRLGDSRVGELLHGDVKTNGLPPDVHPLLTGIRHESVIVLAAFQRKDFVWPPYIFYEFDGFQQQLAVLSDVFPVVWCSTIPFVINDPTFLYSCNLRRPVSECHTFGDRPFDDFSIWAAAHGSLRHTLVVPPDDPFAAVEEALRQVGQGEELRSLLGADGMLEFARQVRVQCVALTEGVLDRFAEALLVSEPRASHPIDLLWHAYRAAAVAHQLRWNRQLEKYEVAGG
jgi:hypothetical protein